MFKRGRKIFYDNRTGEVLTVLNEIESTTNYELTLDEEIATFAVLTQRNKETFEFLQLEFGQYSQDFAECIGYRVNVETKTLEFSYPNSNEPTVEQPYQKPLSEKVKQLELAQSVTDTTLLELMESLLQ